MLSSYIVQVKHKRYRPKGDGRALVLISSGPYNVLKEKFV